MIHPQISWGLWNRHTWWGRWALDSRHAGLFTVAIQKRLHKLCSWRSPFSTRLQCREWRLSHWHCSGLISSVWWQLAQRRDKEAGRQHLDVAAASRGSSEHYSHTHTHTHTHTYSCTYRHMFSHTHTHTHTHTHRNLYCRNTALWGLTNMGF